jgi:hypothetical protein
MTTMDMLMDTITPAGPLPELRVSDAIQPEDPSLYTQSWKPMVSQPSNH